ncbi:MAG: hypothetical protein PHV23_03025 [Candidatus Gracilibacteria bacterium]|nr:hypothetical protein [Candidatus Gracilibacteria bacterium]
MNKFKNYFTKYLVIYISTIIVMIIFDLLLDNGGKAELGYLNTLLFLIIILLYISFLIFLGYIIIFNFILNINLKNIELSLLVIFSLISYDFIPQNIINSLDVRISMNLNIILSIISFILYGLFVKHYLKRIK